MTVARDPNTSELTSIDLTELSPWVGVPFGGVQFKEPFSVTDIRRWVTRTDNVNPLHWDEEWAAESRFGQIVAPQSFQGVRVIAYIEITRVSTLDIMGGYNAGEEFFFYGPRVVAGDKFTIDRETQSLRATNSRLGPSLLVSADATYINQRGQVVLRKRSTRLNTVKANIAQLGDAAVPIGQDDEPQWTDEQIAKIMDDKVDYAKSFRTHEKRLFGSVKVGDRLPRCILGPHSGVSIMYAEDCDVEGWGVMHEPRDQMPRLPAAYPPKAADLQRAKVYPARHADNYLYGWARGHVFNRYARERGMPRAFHVGSTESVWVIDHLANWAGEWGFVRHLTIRYGAPVLSGDLTYINAVVTELIPRDAGHGTVHVSYTFEDQNGKKLCTGAGEIELPIV